MNQSQIKKAEAFRALHHSGKILVLLNCWDAASARIFEAAGAPAIATTSSGLGVANGYPDGQYIPREQLVAAVRRITRVVKIPVSVDMEKGYGNSPSEVREMVRAVADAGGIGMNIEDAVESPDILARKIKAIREFAKESGLPFFVNARTDVFLRAFGEPSTRVDESIRRIRIYAEAGADGAFVPGLTDAAAIARIAKESPLPINVMLFPGLPPVAELQKLGVARLSIGGTGAYAAFSLAKKAAEELLTKGTYETLFSSITLSHAELMKLFPTG